MMNVSGGVSTSLTQLASDIQNDARADLIKHHFSCRVYFSYLHYLEKNFPEIDLEALSSEAGLPLSYVRNENNFVSVIFDKRFTDLCIERTGLPDFCYRVGSQPVSSEVMGRVLTFILSHAVPLTSIYARLPSLTEAFSQVTKLKLVSAKGGQLEYRFSAVADDLRKDEREALRENYGNILQNTIGHYSAVPTIKNLPMAEVKVTEVEDFTKLVNDFPEYVLSITLPKAAQTYSDLVVFLTMMGVGALVSSISYYILYRSVEEVWAYGLILPLFTGNIMFALKSSKASRAMDAALESLRNLDHRHHELEQTRNLLKKTSTGYSSFVPRYVLQLLGKTNILEVQYGDSVEKEMTVMFSDLRGFTTMAGNMSSAQTFRFLNSHLKRVAPRIRSNGGFINNYLGDGFLALFPQHPSDALTAAVEMQKVITNYNYERLNYGQQPIAVSTVLHTGQMIFGTLGYEEQLQTTAISDTVNVASRFETICKSLDVRVMASQRTLVKATEKKDFGVRFLGEFTVRGKADKERLFEVIDCYQPELLALIETHKEAFERGVIHYHAGELVEAEKIFKTLVAAVPGDLVAKNFLKMIDAQNGDLTIAA